MLAKQHFSTEQAREFGDKFGIDGDWSCSNDDQLFIESCKLAYEGGFFVF